MSAEEQQQRASPYRRVVLKISGEGFTRNNERGINMASVVELAQETYRAAKSGVELAIVLGGGNILRGAQFSAGTTSIQPATAHYMGMLATIINGLAFQDALEALGLETRLVSALFMQDVAEPNIHRRIERHLSKGRVVILTGGTGRPFVTTDTAAAQAALELKADIVMKATKVDGVFSDDPAKNPHAILYSRITYREFLRQNLRVMDPEAVTKCSEHQLPIVVFNFRRPGNIERAVRGERVGTLIYAGDATTGGEDVSP
ncbi:MAG: UMP kinase [Thermogutta sp.]|nr:UMP kinase [Thermogutta sp.]HOP76232.1 UMP kinase [Thermogutta sp.]HPU06473.1 UMP kinase [Thermogutta sp.]HQF13204.1 UMP kinase [Thermogutta sp.]